MTKLAATLLFMGFLLMFGAVGGMEDPAKADYFLEQLACALAGSFLMFMGTLLIKEENHDS